MASKFFGTGVLERPELIDTQSLGIERLGLGTYH